jgi:tetratricopeptide (TPR) repeat protein
MPAAFGYLLRDGNCTKVKFRFRYWLLYLRWGMALLTCTGTVLILPAAMSRSAWLAAAGGCGIILYSRIQKFKNAKIRNRFTGRFSPFQKVLFACLLAILMVSGSLGMYRMKKDSADGRALMWKIALQTAVRHPLGVGIGNFSGSYGHTQADYFAAGKGTEQEEHVAGNPEYGFNEYLQIAVEQGVISLVLFLGIMGYSVYTGIRRKRIAATASLVALLIAAATSYPFSVLPFLIVMAFLLAWIHAEFKASKVDRSAGSPSPLLVERGWGRGLKDSRGPSVRYWEWLGVVLVAGCLYCRYPTYQAYKQWGRSKALYHAGAYESGVEAYAPLDPLLSDQLTFLFEYAQCLSKSERYEASNRVLEKAVRIGCDPMLYNVMGKNHQALKQYAEAERCFRKAAHIVPGRIYPWYLLANLYVEMGETAKAQETAEIVLTKEPKVQSTAVREMREKMKRLIPNPKFKNQ